MAAARKKGGISSGRSEPRLPWFGTVRAEAILAEAKVAREDLYRFIAEEGIDRRSHPA